MKLIGGADFRFRATNPRYRKDDYSKALLRKFISVLKLAKEHDAVLTVAGDFFDSVKTPYWLTNTITEMIHLYGVKILACHGQHDMAYHSKDLKPSPYYTLLVSGAISIPGKMGIPHGDVMIYGAGWDDLIPSPAETDTHPNVLLLHRTITLKEPPFFLTDAHSSDEVFEALPTYQYIICGDYHEPFVTRKNGKTLINCGSLGRMAINQKDFRPRVYLIDTDADTVEPVYMEIEKDVWDLEAIDRQERNKVSIDTSDLLSAVSIRTDRPDFRAVLDKVIDEVNPTERVKTIIEEVIHEQS